MWLIGGKDEKEREEGDPHTSEHEDDAVLAAAGLKQNSGGASVQRISGCFHNNGQITCSQASSLLWCSEPCVRRMGTAINGPANCI